eukprot:Sro1032_g233550.2  (130) ;mRNA; f:18345-18734
MDPKEFDEMETEEEVETDDDEEEEEEETVKVGNRPFNTRAYVNSFIKVIDTTKAKKHTPDAGIDRILQVHDHMLSVQDFDASRKQYGVGSWDSTQHDQKHTSTFLCALWYQDKWQKPCPAYWNRCIDGR